MTDKRIAAESVLTLLTHTRSEWLFEAIWQVNYINNCDIVFLKTFGAGGEPGQCIDMGIGSLLEVAILARIYALSTSFNKDLSSAHIEDISMVELENNEFEFTLSHLYNAEFVFERIRKNDFNYILRSSPELKAPSFNDIDKSISFNLNGDTTIRVVFSIFFTLSQREARDYLVSRENSDDEICNDIATNKNDFDLKKEIKQIDFRFFKIFSKFFQK